MATRKKVSEAVDKAKDAASEAARDVREAGRRLDDKVRETAGAASEYIEQETGIPAKKSRDWFVVGVWLGIAAVFVGMLYLFL